MHYFAMCKQPSRLTLSKTASPCRRVLLRHWAGADPTNAAAKDAKISSSDPATRATKGGVPAQLSYYDNYLIDNESNIIVDVEATPARFSQEVTAARTMIERSISRFAITPQSLGADKAYGVVWTYDDGSSGSEVYDPRLKKYLWLGASGHDGSYDASMSPGWIGNTSEWQVVLASWPPPLGAYLVTRTSDTRYTEGYRLHGV
jgi:hypothetical protein